MGERREERGCDTKEGAGMFPASPPLHAMQRVWDGMGWDGMGWWTTQHVASVAKLAVHLDSLGHYWEEGGFLRAV